MDGSAALAEQLTNHESTWDIGTHLLASVLDGVHAMIWQNGGGKGARPKPVPRPGGQGGSSTRSKSVPQGDPFNPNESGVFKGEMTPLSELNEWLGWTKEPTRDEKIVSAYADGGVSYRELAAKFGVSTSTVGRVVRAARSD